MTNYTMPVLSEQEREELLGFLTFLRAGSSGQHQVIYQIALAALTAKPAGWGLKSLEEERYGSWLMPTPREQSYLDYQSHKYENVQLYPAPPVPVKQEGEK